MGKPRYYGLATREEMQDIEDKSRGSRVYPSTFGYRAVKTALLNYKDEHSNFNDLNVQVAVSRIAETLTKTGLYGTVKARGKRIIGEGYSVALTKGRGTGNKITISRASERLIEEEQEKKK